ncbi:hypothetical protein EOS_35650 [Caballeronia mineralivorans PML1(12)]|uniref:Uncharacterized protein n=1 Tax=Caballeronia mineralivorans PML1(12) TaxID=908627 RepID=A0A0J1CL65_9BURK|nr:hypothetical protein EOS_35650 [Caballeronia mineralivorans PML1(12)]
MREIHGLVKGDVSDADVAHCFKASFGLENECTNERLKTAGLVLSEYDHPISSINSYVTDNSTALAVEIYALKVGKVNAFRADGRLDQDGFIQFTADHLGMKVDDARDIVWGTELDTIRDTDLDTIVVEEGGAQNPAPKRPRLG